MEDNDWVLTLPPGAETLRSGSTANPSRDVIGNTPTTPVKNVKRANIEAGLIRNRPIMRDVLNDSR